MSDFKTVQIKSTKDGTDQPSRVFIPDEAKTQAVPLLVWLHSWSSDYKQNDPATVMIPEAGRRGWAVVMPNFRGPNKQPEACGSDLAVQDILDAVAYVRSVAKIDPQRIYIAGASGGGHMTMLMTTRAADLWAAASAWVPITDIAAWHAQTKQAGRGYWKMIEGACGGAPGASDAVDAEYRQRSSLFHLDQAKGLPIDINTGIHDGHTGSVPVSQTLLAFNRLAVVNGHPDAQVPTDLIDAMVDTQKVPAPLADEHANDDPQRKREVLFRRAAGPVRVTVFEGTHESDILAAMRWLAQFRKD